MNTFFGFVGLLIGASISIFIAMAQIFNANKARILDRKINTFKLAIDSACEFLHITEQEIVRHKEELDDWASRNRSARLNHLKAIGYLRMEGCDHIADEFVKWYDYVVAKGRAYLSTDEGWQDVKKRAYLLIGMLEAEIKKIEQEAFLPRLKNWIESLIPQNNFFSR